MPRYVDPLDAMRAREQELRSRIGDAVLGGRSVAGLTLEDAADQAIADWNTTGMEESDLGAFRPLSDLQKLLAEHHQIQAIITEELERRLG